jgi:hypothetical protein
MWKAFELLPGCHIVTTPTRWKRGSDEGDPEIGGMVARTGELTFAFLMRPGYAYDIAFEVASSFNSLPVGEGWVVAREVAQSGKVVRTFRPSRPQEIDACLDAAPARYAQPR